METNTTGLNLCESILIVEDEPAIRAALREALEWEGYRVFTAENGKEGLEMLPDMPTPCLILLDLMMPIMNGWEFADALRTDMVLASIPIVIVSAFTEMEGKIPNKGIIKKPVNLDLLFALVKQYCSAGRP